LRGCGATRANASSFTHAGDLCALLHSLRIERAG